MTDASRYLVPAIETRTETVIEKSRFIATVAPACDVPEALALIARVSDEFRAASHNCYAYLVGPPGSVSSIGMSDDGEPHGTAGRPMLNVLTHCGIGDVVAVVTRYFGGRKLGRGGLVRAYGGSLQSALESIATQEKIDWAYLEVAFPYAMLDWLRRVYPEWEVEVLDEQFGANVIHRIRLPASVVERMVREVGDHSRGEVVPLPDDPP